MEFNFEDDDGSEYTIEFKKIVDDKKLLSTTRLLAVDIMKNGYVNIGEFFQNMPESDLKSYLNMAEDLESDKAAEVVLLSSMLCIGEGLDNGLSEENLDGIANRVSQLIMYLACESLARQGLVRIYREHMSFGEDMADKMLVEKLF